MRRTRVIVWLVALAVAAALAGCATGSGSPETASASPTKSSSPRPSVEFASPRATPARGGSDVIIGILGADSVEGGCAYLEADDGLRYQVLYPSGWRVQATPLSLTNPEGEVVATGGETISVRGSHAGDMASICQVGPIFRATEVLSIED